ncbi:sensor histidine kinase [Tepidibacter hydrothermalis]|uniref:GHKL domain-containing protein n=1 Tax=Tepidibacter hydrothermalis TaxID=3036126 RepID=A0ABY8EAL9_9FIRM|nr:GHKL domain-containing protein [Tepidibacter hydrothermalis]WFD09948.1 GHKL domain-containing protein [Tepidibacter hydrothermalis]
MYYVCLFVVTFLCTYSFSFVFKILEDYKHYNRSYEINDDDTDKVFWIYIVFVTMLFIVVVYYYENIDKNLNQFIVFFIFLFICCSLLSYFVYLVVDKLYKEKSQKKDIQLYANMIEESLENLRAFKHDYRNTLMCISGYIASKNMEGLEKYFYENLVNDKYINNSIYGSININNIPLKGLINLKASKASSLGIDFNLNIEQYIEDFILKDVDICKIFGILIDNAIEASVESKEKIINININEENEKIIIKISNTYNLKPDLNNIFIKGYSTKGRDRGLGLDIVKKINDKQYTNMNMNTYIKEDLFNQEIIIDKK